MSYSTILVIGVAKTWRKVSSTIHKLIPVPLYFITVKIASKWPPYKLETASQCPLDHRT